MLSAILRFISYWYFRYTVVTELYMVEKWERYSIHIIFGTVLLLCWFFNTTVLLTAVSNLVAWQNCRSGRRDEELVFD